MNAVEAEAREEVVTMPSLDTMEEQFNYVQQIAAHFDGYKINRQKSRANGRVIMEGPDLDQEVRFTYETLRLKFMVNTTTLRWKGNTVYGENGDIDYPSAGFVPSRPIPAIVKELKKKIFDPYQLVWDGSKKAIERWRKEDEAIITTMEHVFARKLTDNEVSNRRVNIGTRNTTRPFFEISAIQFSSGETLMPPAATRTAVFQGSFYNISAVKMKQILALVFDGQLPQ